MTVLTEALEMLLDFPLIIPLILRVRAAPTPPDVKDSETVLVTSVVLDNSEGDRDEGDLATDA